MLFSLLIFFPFYKIFFGTCHMCLVLIVGFCCCVVFAAAAVVAILLFTYFLSHDCIYV